MSEGSVFRRVRDVCCLDALPIWLMLERCFHTDGHLEGVVLCAPPRDISPYFFVGAPHESVERVWKALHARRAGRLRRVVYQIAARSTRFQWP